MKGQWEGHPRRVGVGEGSEKERGGETSVGGQDRDVSPPRDFFPGIRARYDPYFERDGIPDFPDLTLRPVDSLAVVSMTMTPPGPLTHYSPLV